MKRTIIIVGLGLIGGSIAKNLVQSDQNYIIGYDSNNDAMEFALRSGIIHQYTTDYSELVHRADYILLATPISETIRIIRELDQMKFDQDVIVTDVASVKKSILDSANTLTNKQITFIGGHPMAGSHKKGIHAAKAHLFENAIYVLTPSLKSSQKEIEKLKKLLDPLKSHFVILKSDEHDEMTGVVSHFPHLIASSLVHQAKKWENTHTYLPKLAAGGFRDITRIASSNPEMWQDIFYHNRIKMKQLLEEWISEMSSLKDLLARNDKEKMIDYLGQAKDYRDGLGYKDKGAIPSFYDLYVDIQDQPGALASVVHILATKDISINNIQILEIREGITGVLRLTLPTRDAILESYRLLQSHGYEVMKED